MRHGQSAGNVARDSAEAAGLPVIDIAQRDIDVPLSELGRTQATALGHWFGELPPTGAGAALARRLGPLGFLARELAVQIPPPVSRLQRRSAAARAA